VAERKKEAGPRGGTSTVYKSGLLRKTAYFYAEEWEAIRKAAYEREVSYTDVIRESVRAHLKLDL
jgi:hypothetical protein